MVILMLWILFLLYHLIQLSETVHKFLVLYLYVSHQFLVTYSDVLVLMW